MLTKADKKFFKVNFVTKNDLKGLAKQKDILRVEKKIDELTEYVMPALGNIFKWTDDIHKALIGKPSHASSEN